MSTLHRHGRIRVLIGTSVPAIGEALRRTLLRLSEGGIEVELRESDVSGTRAWCRGDLDASHPAVSLCRSLDAVASRRARGDDAVEAVWEAEIATANAEGAEFDVCIRANPRRREMLSGLKFGAMPPAGLATLGAVLDSAHCLGRVETGAEPGPIEVQFAGARGSGASGLAGIVSWLLENGWPGADLAADALVPIVVECDDPDAFPFVETSLAEAGFGPVTFTNATVEDVSPSFVVQRPLGGDYTAQERLVATIARMQDVRGVDPRLHGPVKVQPDPFSTLGEQLRWRVTLPFAAARAGAVEPTTGDMPQRFVLRLHTDDVPRVTRELVPSLVAAGFRTVEVDALPSPDPADIEVTLRRAQYPDTLETLAEILECWRLESWLPGGVSDKPPAGAPTNVVDVHIPIGPDGEARRERLRAELGKHRVYIRGGGSLAHGLRETLAAQGFGRVVLQGVERRRAERGDWTIQVGSASSRVNRTLCREVERLFGFRPRVVATYYPDDPDILIHVPEVMVEGIAPPEYLPPSEGGMQGVYWSTPGRSDPYPKPLSAWISLG